MPGEIGRLLTFEPARVKGNAVVVLAVVSALLYFTILGLYVGRFSEEIVVFADGFRGGAKTEPAAVLPQWMWEVTDPAVRALFRDESPLLSMLFWLAMWGAPWLALLIASDQTSSELGRRHIRFILPRASRRNIYLARAFSSWVAWALVCAVAMVPIGALLTAIEPDGAPGSNVVLVLRMTAVLAVYGMPFVALMSVVNTFIPNAFLAFLTGIGICTVVALLASIGGWFHDAYGHLRFLLPVTVKYPLMSHDAGRFVAGAAGGVLYTAVYLAAGDWVFRSRDM